MLDVIHNVTVKMSKTFPKTSVCWNKADEMLSDSWGLCLQVCFAWKTVSLHTLEKNAVSLVVRQTGSAINTRNTWCIIFRFDSFNMKWHIECVQLLTRVPHVSRVPLIKRRERDTSVGSKVTNTLPIFSRTDQFHLAAKMTYHRESLQASLAAHDMNSMKFVIPLHLIS